MLSLWPSGVIEDIHVGGKRKQRIAAEVVGFRDENVLLMPFSTVHDISPGCMVEATGKPLQVKVGVELIGKVLDSLGSPLDQSKLPKGLTAISIEQSVNNCQRRGPNPFAFEADMYRDTVPVLLSEPKCLTVVVVE